jgi:hypothetical protein
VLDSSREHLSISWSLAGLSSVVRLGLGQLLALRIIAGWVLTSWVSKAPSQSNDGGASSDGGASCDGGVSNDGGASSDSGACFHGAKRWTASAPSPHALAGCVLAPLMTLGSIRRCGFSPLDQTLFLSDQTL